jgi:hypothetical protein
LIANFNRETRINTLELKELALCIIQEIRVGSNIGLLTLPKVLYSRLGTDINVPGTVETAVKKVCELGETHR